VATLGPSPRWVISNHCLNNWILNNTVVEELGLPRVRSLPPFLLSTYELFSRKLWIRRKRDLEKQKRVKLILSHFFHIFDSFAKSSKSFLTRLINNKVSFLWVQFSEQKKGISWVLESYVTKVGCEMKKKVVHKSPKMAGKSGLFAPAK